MVAHVKSCTLVGVDAEIVDVECEISRGLPFYNVVGLAATSVKEGAVRLRSALTAVGYDVPLKRVTVNLAPADLKKPGTALDLPIAAAVLVANGDCGGRALDGLVVIGELGLDGSVRGVRGVLAASLLARERGLRGVVVPDACAEEARAVDDIEVYVVDHVQELIDVLKERRPLRPPCKGDARPQATFGIDMSEVRGQHVARLAIEVAVAGGHNVMLAGPPGAGKTMLARRIPTVLPAMTHDEALETTKVYSALGLADRLIVQRPFRAPHHSISSAALLGGGLGPRPGEISLAHNGVLFLDEIPEFTRSSIEGLRQPLEERSVVITRVSGSIRLPASFLLVAAANPCPCGWFRSDLRECTCSPSAIERYRLRLSGPILDRIDMQIYVGPVEFDDLRKQEPGESSAAIRNRVTVARERQLERLAPWNLHCNAEMTGAILRATCPLDAAAERMLADIVTKRQTMTARSIDRLIKVARTIADLDGEDAIDAAALDLAASFRDVDPAADVLPRVA